MEAQQRLNFSQKRKEVQQWLVATLNAEPVFRGLDPNVVRALAIRCKFRVNCSASTKRLFLILLQAYPRRVALIVEGAPPGAGLFMLRKGVLEESRDGVHQAYWGRGTTFNAKGWSSRG